MGQMFTGLRSAVGGRTNPTEEKAIAFSRYYNDLAVRGLRGNAAQNWSLARAVTEGYERVIWVFKSVNVLATDSSGLPFRLREGNAVVDDHPLYRVLNRKANQLESGQVFRKRLSSQVLLSNRGAFVQRVMSNGGTVKELHLLPPDRVEIIPGVNDLISHFQFQRRDGSVKNLGPEEVLWFRDPHPTDPYSGITPLEAAGMSVELDHFARLYNVSFMQNDGRPGGVLAVRASDGSTSSISDTQMNRIEDRFGKGPVEAGKLSVIAGELSYIDLAASPRDMQYGQTSSNSKMELLAAFGMSEVVLGNAAGRTFDNADAEMYNYWTRTVPAHNKVLLDGFDEDSNDDFVGFFDTSEIEVLERASVKRREEARAEVKDGLRSIKSYADLAGYGEEIEDNIYTRSVYQPNGKTPIPTKPGDAKQLGLDTEEPAPEGEAAPELAPEPLAPPGGPIAALPAPEAPEAAVGAPDAPSVVEGVDMAALLAPMAPQIKSLASLRGGARPKVTFALSQKSWQASEPDVDAHQRLETELGVALALLTERWFERAEARISSPKQRKGTRHWVPEFDDDTRMGSKALDAGYAASEEQWQEEAESEVSPIVTAAAIAFAVVILTDMGITPPPGRTIRDLAATAVKGIVVEVVKMIGASARQQARNLINWIVDADQRAASMEEIRAMIRERAVVAKGWADRIGTTAGTGTLNGSRDGATEVAVEVDPALEVDRQWITRRDDRVRPSHRLAHGQNQPWPQPFVVGETTMRFPCDPRAPLHETAGCRCRLRFRHRRTGRWTSNPAFMAPILIPASPINGSLTRVGAPPNFQ